MWSDIADVVTCVKFCNSWFRGWEYDIPDFAIVHKLTAGRPYKCASSTVLHCGIIANYVTFGSSEYLFRCCAVTQEHNASDT